MDLDSKQSLDMSVDENQAVNHNAAVRTPPREGGFRQELHQAVDGNKNAPNDDGPTVSVAEHVRNLGARPKVYPNRKSQPSSSCKSTKAVCQRNDGTESVLQHNQLDCRDFHRRRKWHFHDRRSKIDEFKRSKAIEGHGVRRKSLKGVLRIKVLDLARLQELRDSGLEDRALCQTLISQTSGLTELLNAEMIESDSIQILLELISRASRVSVREYVLPLLSNVAQSRFLEHHLAVTYLPTAAHKTSSHEQNLASEANSILDILSCILGALPTYFDKCLVVLIVLEKLLTARDICTTETLPEVQRISALLDRARDIGSRFAETKGDTKRKRDIRLPFDEVPPPNDFRQLSVCPTYGDIHTNRRPFIRVNKEKGGYEDLGHYLDVQFRLLREDYIRPLREGIAEYLGNLKAGKPWAKLTDLRLYQGVKIIFPTCLLDGVAHRIQFDTTHLRKVQWQDSKRLIYGSLLCFSKDDFQTCLFATVIGRDVKDLHKGFLDICFIDHIDSQTISNQNFVMLETTAYFEPYKHVLGGLQETVDDMPFQRYVVSCERDVRPPQYLCRDVPAVYDLSFCVKEGASESEKQQAKAIPVLTTSRWPGTETLCFDDSQLKAMKTALTKEFAIVQGPPGTGKTYVGLKLVQALLTNKAAWGENKLILIVCYTNHALDQFLEGMLDFGETRLCRVGGRSKSERLKHYTLKKKQENRILKKGIGKVVSKARSDCCRRMKTLQRSVDKISVKLDLSKKGILQEKALKEFMTEDQIRGFGLSTEESIRGKTTMPLWLHVCDDIFEQFEGFGHSRLYALRPEHIERFLSQTCVYQRESFEKIQFLEFSHGELQKDLALFDHLRTSTGTNRVGQAMNPARERNWEEYKQLHLSFIEEQKRLNIYARKQIQKPNKSKRELQHMRQLEENTEKTLFILGKTRGILRASVLSDIMTREEKKYFGLHKKPLDDYFFTGWLGYGVVTDILLREMDSSKDDNTKETNSPEYDNDEEQALPETEEDCEGFSLANAHKTRTHLSIEIADQELSINPGKNGKAPFSESEKQWKRNESNKTQTKERIKQILRIGDKMNQEEADTVVDIWELHSTDRCRLYSYWLGLYRTQLQNKLEALCEEYNEESEKLKKIREDEYYQIMKSSSVIGMTTTGAAKYRAILHQLQPPIIVVEEAAEVLESHVISTLTPSCEHLILIGDHKQLRPSPAVYELARYYNLELSLFERMVNNGVRCDTLALQHRMRPEIADLMRFIYPSLRNHHSVQGFESVKGVSCSVFFLNHQVEETAHEESKSHSNRHEAQFLAALCQYLLLQGYEPSEITVLTTYSGQVFELKKTMKEKNSEGVLVTSVDNYQGEENDIILLSLVRSNHSGSIGFLSVENRVCVALSRARKGLFVIGNFTMLKSQSPLWSDMVNRLNSKGFFGNELELYCHNHPDAEKVKVKTCNDFDCAPLGGCKRKCESRLKCGHRCTLVCHIRDTDHIEYKCKKMCGINCGSGHPCKKPCYEECGKCNVIVQKVIPKCGHTQGVPCHENLNVFKCKVEVQRSWPCGHLVTTACHIDPKDFSCPEPCTATLDCGHPCTRKCGESHTEKCEVKVQRSWPCGHLVTTACHNDASVFPCPEVCTAILDCCHPCTRKCGESHTEECKVKVQRNWPCGHLVTTACHNGPNDFPCPEPCTATLDCGHPCTRKCGERHTEKCKVEVKRNWPCGHLVTTACHIGVKDFSCPKPCTATLDCGHPCTRKCGESHTEECKVKVKRKWPCGHLVTTACHIGLKDFSCPKPCTATLDCGHPCTRKCGESHTEKCKVEIQRRWPCGHLVTTACHIGLKDFSCPKPCTATLDCGHPCTRKCGESHTEKCKVEVQRKWPCGHLVTTACHISPNDFPCPEPCTATLDCGHPCAGSCSRCLQGRLHEACKYRCRRILVCGHECRQNCTKACPPCRRKCENRCVHSRCEKACGDACTPCRKPCIWRCKHLACSKLCGEICDRPPCNSPCTKYLLCGHRCVGLCGETCPPLCGFCNKGELRKTVFGTEKRAQARFVYLEDCQHTIEVTAMDKWMALSAKGSGSGDSNPSLKRCPKCKVVIRHSLRYGNVVKKTLADIETKKKEVRRNMTIIADEVRDLKQASDVKHFTEMFGAVTSTENEEESKVLRQIKTRIESWNVAVGISDQEIRESKNEVFRLTSLMKARLYKSKLEKHTDLSFEVTTKLESTIQRLESGGPFKSNMKKELSKQMEDLERLAPLEIIQAKTERRTDVYPKPRRAKKCIKGKSYVRGKNPADGRVEVATTLSVFTFFELTTVTEKMIKSVQRYTFFCQH